MRSHPCFLKNTKFGKDCNGQLTNRVQLSGVDLWLLRVRTGCKVHIKSVCAAHSLQFLSSFSNHQRLCCDPLKLHNDTEAHQAKRKKSLSEISIKSRREAKILYLNLIPGKKICIACKVKLNSQIAAKKKEREEATAEGSNVSLVRYQSSPSVHSSQASAASSKRSACGQFVVTDDNDQPFTVPTLDGLNTWLKSQGFSPICLRQLQRQASYRDQVFNNLRTVVEKVAGVPFCENPYISRYQDIILKIQDFIKSTNKQSKKLLALTILPQTMSISEIETTFGVSQHLARKSRAIAATQGILVEPGKKKSRNLAPETTQLVISFFLRDDISRPLPGRKDVVRVVVYHEDGTREKVEERKRLVLGTLGSLYQQFIEENPNKSISLSKFCDLRPKQCVLAGRAGTHVVCVCTYHENPNLMFEHGHLKCESLGAVRDCRALLLCDIPTRECFLRTCPECPDSLRLREILEVHFDAEVIDNVTYNQWESTDRSNLVTLTKTSEDFIDDFVARIETLIPHDFIYKQQVDFVKRKTENLVEGEVIANCDFGENFSFVIQRASQSSYFDTPQATIHPFVIYYKEDGELKHHCFVIISDHMTHNTAAVHVYQKKLIDHIVNIMKIKLSKIYYVSDGCAAQYKNKKAVANIWFHQQDFNVPAEWHFSATSHGKSAVDGATGRIKSLVYQNSLRVTEAGEQITTPQKMFEWVQENVKGMTSHFVPSSEVKEHESRLMVRFGTALDIEGIQSHHAIIPCEVEPYVQLKVISNDSIFTLRKISTRECLLNIEDVRGYIIFGTNDVQLGLVCGENILDESFSVQLFAPTERLYCFSFTDKIIDVSLQDILCLVTPTLQKKGTIVKILAKDWKDALAKFNSLKT